MVCTEHHFPFEGTGGVYLESGAAELDGEGRKSAAVAVGIDRAAADADVKHLEEIQGACGRAEREPLHRRVAAFGVEFAGADVIDVAVVVRNAVEALACEAHQHLCDLDGAAVGREVVLPVIVGGDVELACLVVDDSVHRSVGDVVPARDEVGEVLAAVLAEGEAVAVAGVVGCLPLAEPFVIDRAPVLAVDTELFGNCETAGEIAVAVDADGEGVVALAGAQGVVDAACARKHVLAPV